VVGGEMKGKWGIGSSGQGKERGKGSARMGLGKHGRE